MRSVTSMHMEHPRTITISLRRARSNLHFGAHAGEMKVNSTKSMVGHMLGAPERSSLSLV